MVLAAPQLLARLGIDQVRGTREDKTHFHHSPSASTTLSCTIYQELHTSLQIITKTHPANHCGDQVKLKAKPGEEGPADHLWRRRTSRSQARRSRSARSKSPSTAAVHSHTFAQLQAKVVTMQKHHC
jgi:hypothetical protein